MARDYSRRRKRENSLEMRRLLEAAVNTLVKADHLAPIQRTWKQARRSAPYARMEVRPDDWSAVPRSA